jgi:hypothetical protein
MSGHSQLDWGMSEKCQHLKEAATCGSLRFLLLQRETAAIPAELIGSEAEIVPGFRALQVSFIRNPSGTNVSARSRQLTTGHGATDPWAVA